MRKTGVFKKEQIAKARRYKLRKSAKPLLTKPTKTKYLIRFVSGDTVMGERETVSYKVALFEAERWVLESNYYFSEIIWNSSIGERIIRLDFASVKEQRQLRNTYKKALQNNTYREAFVSP